MNRFKRFVSNAGLRGCILTSLVAVVVFFALRKDVQTGLWPWTSAVIVAAVALAYLARNVLVDNLNTTRVLMNVLALAVFVSVTIGRRWLPNDDPWFRITLAAFLGAYMGCYFWLMSDERIVNRKA